jgi:hypothetical protein
MWSCPSCTFENNPPPRKCDLCGFDVPMNKCQSSCPVIPQQNYECLGFFILFLFHLFMYLFIYLFIYFYFFLFFLFFILFLFFVFCFFG